MSGQISLTPLKGLMSCGDQLARRFGLERVWDGEDGLRAVAEDVLKDAGVPLSIEVSPRSIAQGAGLVKRTKTKKKRGGK